MMADFDIEEILGGIAGKLLHVRTSLFMQILLRNSTIHRKIASLYFYRKGGVLHTCMSSGHGHMGHLLGFSCIVVREVGVKLLLYPNSPPSQPLNI